jgi:hypothetical protein
VVELRVTDTNGNKDWSTATVTVEGASSPSPTPTPTPANPEFAVTNIDAPESIESDAVASVTITVQNTGQADGTYDAALAIDGEPVGTKSVSIAAGSSEQVSFEINLYRAGTRTLAIGNASQEITVEAQQKQSADAVYRSDDNKVTTDEALDALVKFNEGKRLPGHGKLSPKDIMKVIAAMNAESS